jgi:transcriptional regulator with XRE-family HTH domain
MDAAALIRQARERAGFTKTALGKAAGTSPSAVIAYETGQRSPTVATLDRLLAACGLQVRAVLEPYLADLDAAVDDLLAGSGAGVADMLQDIEQLAGGLDAAGVRWAFDAQAALALHGLGTAPLMPQIVVLGDDRLRELFGQLGVDTLGHDGQPLWRSWVDDRLDLARVGVVQGYTPIGVFEARVADPLPTPLRMAVDGRDLPVLSLLDLEAAHPALSDVLARLRHRRTVAA